MTFTYTNPGKDPVFVGDVCFAPSQKKELAERYAPWEQAVKNGVLTLEISGDIPQVKSGFTVLFDRMQHGANPAPVKYLSAGDKVELPALSEEGWTFGGWFKDRALTEEWTSDTEVSGNTTLYAKWTKGGFPAPVPPKVEKVATPTCSPKAGEIESGNTVTLTCGTSGADIYYTTDKSTPTNKKEKYSEAILISETTTIKAIAVKAGWEDSDVMEATFTVSEE